MPVRTSIHSGVCCTRCSPGEWCSNATVISKLWAHVHDRPPRLPKREMPPGLQDVLDRALAKDRRDRQQSAAALADQLAAAIAG
jgi:serine/threonine protein kinase